MMFDELINNLELLLEEQTLLLQAEATKVMASVAQGNPDAVIKRRDLKDRKKSDIRDMPDRVGEEQ